ncbi:hypothetical protein SAMN00017405_1801 [Desulfonispora thiosulfatigenes DSM 11270]|uniref:DUF7852 domain-containing protein n=2 Tax=Desulfonispora thiosulfatigenes TaxID=83661 RepID=A0A1W1V3K5_DESTI|nr:hypothetical protein SAMN00017405_1801 [Desulfonispora thiosulfatigenes DSM 11270]
MWPEGKQAESQVEVSAIESNGVVVQQSDDRRLNYPVRQGCADVTGGTQSDCINTPVDIVAIDTGVVAKIPVVLSEFTVQVNASSLITLPENALEIKNIKKKLKITQCILLQDTNMLFIKGYVRKNIDYSTRNCANNAAVCGNLRHCTVDVPFSCTTPVTFNGIAPAPLINGTSNEFQFMRKEDLNDDPSFAEKDELLSGDFSEYNQSSTEFYNERPYCELISSRIVEYDEYINWTRPTCGKYPFEEREFNKIEEKMVIFLTLKLLQKRQVVVPATLG